MHTTITWIIEKSLYNFRMAICYSENFLLFLLSAPSALAYLWTRADCPRLLQRQSTIFLAKCIPTFRANKEFRLFESVGVVSGAASTLRASSAVLDSVSVFYLRDPLFEWI